MKSFITALISGIFVLYPFVIYFGLNYLPPSMLALVLLSFLLLRLMILKNSLVKMPWVLPATILGAIVILTSSVSNSYIGFKLYPIMVNVTMLFVFAYSYIKPPTVIETIARIKEKHLTDDGVLYTSRVTLVWCAFFIINSLISLYTVVFSSLEGWMLYNGLISYLLMAMLMCLELLIRRRVKNKHMSMKQLNDNKPNETAIDD